MRKELRQAVQHANETNPSSRGGTQPHTSKKDKDRSRIKG
jgi:hypothetical protein